MEPLKIFYSYAHEDRDLCEVLKKYLMPLKHVGLISDWYDRMISPGKEWAHEIDQHLGSADLIVLLVSADFMASDYCWSVEMERAMERHTSGEARVVPIILRPCYWQVAPFQKLQCLPTEAQPVTDWPNIDAAFLDVTHGIGKAADELRETQAQTKLDEQRRLQEQRAIEEQRRLEQESLEKQRRIEAQRRFEEQSQADERQRRQPMSDVVWKLPSRGLLRWLVGGFVIGILVIGYVALDQHEESDDPSSGTTSSATTEPENMHGRSAEEVQNLQEQAAQEVGKTVEFRDRLKDDGEGPQMVVIPAGKFMMGSPKTEEGRGDDERQHPVVIEQPFAIGKYEVTFDQYDRFAEARGREKPDDEGWGRGRRPVINVNWFDAVAYAQWLSEQTGQQYRLPTEAEWEYAARAGTATPFWFGETISTAQANYDGNYVYGAGRKGEYRQKTVPVDTFEPNPWGLYNLHGNVWEWTCSEYDAGYNGLEMRCADKDDTNNPRVLWSGSWLSNPRRLRSAYRYWSVPGYRYDFRGFRLARSF